MQLPTSNALLKSSSAVRSPAMLTRNVCTRRAGFLRVHALPDWMRSLLDFESWAPKSTRIWRLNVYEYPDSKPDEIDELEARINRLASTTSSSTSTNSLAGSKNKPAASTDPVLQDSAAELPATGSFTEAGDSELARALSARMQSLTSVSSRDGEEEEEEKSEGEKSEEEKSEEGEEEGVVVAEADQVEPLTGKEIRQLLLQKYGKTYDLSFVRRDIPGKTFVTLNIMWQHLEQRSFRLTEEQYMEKIDSVAYLVNVLGRAQRVRAFLQQPARSSKGLPRRPVVGTAISIQLDLEPELVAEFFSKGYQ